MRDFHQQVLAELRDALVRDLESKPPNAPEVADALAELRALRRLRAKIAAHSEQAKQAFGIEEDE